ncbi:MAG: hypothetical protein IPJ82_13730 [Lewinellaceae bacterium]|nr:hypothetical protein [Lewinellaceae bacterium]
MAVKNEYIIGEGATQLRTIPVSECVPEAELTLGATFFRIIIQRIGRVEVNYKAHPDPLVAALFWRSSITVIPITGLHNSRLYAKRAIFFADPFGILKM